MVEKENDHLISLTKTQHSNTLAAIHITSLHIHSFNNQFLQYKRKRGESTRG